MKKNILIIISSLGGGGAERVATTIGSHLNKENEVFYLTRYDKENEYDFSGNKICIGDIISTSYIKAIYRMIKRTFIIRKISKKYNIDYCISFMEESNFPNIFSKYLLKNKSKIIISIRVSVDSMSRVYKTFIKLFYNKADLIIPNSNEEKWNLICKYGIDSNKITTISNPLDLREINVLGDEDIKQKIFKKNLFSFITVGRLVDQKNQKFLIDCFNKFSLEYPNTQLIIIGDGPLKNELLRLSENKNIILLGYQRNVYKYLRHSDCFIFSSLCEGFPNAVLEAMACGLPVISTMFKTGIKEIIGDDEYGIIVRKRNEKDFVNAMKYLYKDKEKLKFYKKRSLLRCKKYDINNIINEWKNIL